MVSHYYHDVVELFDIVNILLLDLSSDAYLCRIVEIMIEWKLPAHCENTELIISGSIIVLLELS